LKYSKKGNCKKCRNFVVISKWPLFALGVRQIAALTLLAKKLLEELQGLVLLTKILRSEKFSNEKSGNLKPIILVKKVRKII
jgi:hypothetical protein